MAADRLSCNCPIQPYVLNGADGIVAEGPGATSAYYSAPRLAAQGTLVLDGQQTAIHGRGWFDHQWGNFVMNTASWHWNWFACQFRNGGDLMLYQFIANHYVPGFWEGASAITTGTHGTCIVESTRETAGGF